MWSIRQKTACKSFVYKVPSRPHVFDKNFMAIMLRNVSFIAVVCNVTFYVAIFYAVTFHIHDLHVIKFRLSITSLILELVVHLIMIMLVNISFISQSVKRNMTFSTAIFYAMTFTAFHDIKFRLCTRSTNFNTYQIVCSYSYLVFIKKILCLS